MQSLLYHQGNKLQAAGSLGMSRATIYRKIHEYGILTPAPAPHYALRVTLEAASGSRLLTDALHPVHTLCIRTAHGCPVLEQQTGRLGAHSASVITLCPRFALGRPAILRSTGRPVAGGQRAAGGPHVRPAGTATPGGPATWNPVMALMQIIPFRAADVTAAQQIKDHWLRVTEGKRTVFYDLDMPWERV